jgi:uncharacterized sulfatase
MCSPTRHCIYTGLYPVSSGAYPQRTFAKPGTQSIVHYLKPLGYRVALNGKSHVAPKSVFPFEYARAGKRGKQIDWPAVEELLSDSAQNESPFCLFVCSTEPHQPWNKGDVSRYDAARL